MTLEYDPASQEKPLEAALLERGYAYQRGTQHEDYYEATDGYLEGERAQLHLIHKPFDDFTQITVSTWKKDRQWRGEYAALKNHNVKYLVFGRTILGKLATVIIVNIRYGLYIYDTEVEAGDRQLWDDIPNHYNGHEFIGLRLKMAKLDNRGLDFNKLLVDCWSYPVFKPGKDLASPMLKNLVHGWQPLDEASRHPNRMA